MAKPKRVEQPQQSRRGAEAIEQWPIERFRAYMRNSRTHSQDQVKKIAASIERFGFTNPVLAAEDGTIIAGHGRVMAAQLLKITTLPVIVATGWSDDERKAYVIADNKIAADSGWDEEMLRLEMGDLQAAGFDLALTGFDEAELAKALNLGGDEDAGADLEMVSLFQILIDCGTEQEQLELLTELQKRGIKCRALIA